MLKCLHYLCTCAHYIDVSDWESSCGTLPPSQSSNPPQDHGLFITSGPNAKTGHPPLNSTSINHSVRSQ